MSVVEYTRCDGEGCGRVTVWPDGEYDLCPECARKALRAVGIEVEP